MRQPLAGAGSQLPLPSVNVEEIAPGHRAAGQKAGRKARDRRRHGLGSRRAFDPEPQPVIRHIDVASALPGPPADEVETHAARVSVVGGTDVQGGAGRDVLEKARAVTRAAVPRGGWAELAVAKGIEALPGIKGGTGRQGLGLQSYAVLSMQS